MNNLFICCIYIYLYIYIYIYIRVYIIHFFLFQEENVYTNTMEERNIKKQVSFNDVPTFHVLYDDNDIISYRKPYWELSVLDRHRFRRKIEHVSKEINMILDNKHRSYIYNKICKV